MRPTEQTLLEQMQISDFEIESRKALFSLTLSDVEALQRVRPFVEDRLDDLVARFYERQTSIPEIALLIGDAGTLERLRNAQRRYIVDLFSGVYDVEYVNNRLRIGLVHKRIGVEPKLYLSAMHTLETLLRDLLRAAIADDEEFATTSGALTKLMMLDTSLVFDTYIRSLLSEIETAKDASDTYARALEAKVRERTAQLEEMARTDPLTGLLNVRHLHETLTRALRSAQRRSEPVTVVYMDVNGFKAINDTKGHQYGDEVLRAIGSAITRVSRMEDACFRAGGDEFCLILPSCTEREAREICVTRLNAEIRRHRRDVVLSIGVVQTGPETYADPSTLLREADERMYADKRAFGAGVRGDEDEPSGLGQAATGEDATPH